MRWALSAAVAVTTLGPPVAAPAPPPSVAVGTWWDRTAPGPGGALPASRHLAVRSDLPPERTKAFADRLDVMFDDFESRLAARSGLRRRLPSAPTVMMFARRQDYLDTLRTRFGIDATGSGGMFFSNPRGTGLAFWVEGLTGRQVDRVVQREAFRQFVFPYFGHELPPWLGDGLAEMYGESTVAGSRVIFGQASPSSIAALRSAVEAGRQPPLLELLSMDADAWNARGRPGDACVRLLQGWSFVHYLIHADNGIHERRFNDLLRRLNAGTAPLDALRQSLSLAPELEPTELEARWKDYVTAMRPGAFVAARDRLEFLAEGMRQAWAAGGRPRDLDELKAALRKAGFSHVPAGQCAVVALDARDDASFTLPADGSSRGPVSIELVPQPAARGAKARRLAEEHPMPPMLRTHGLRPSELGVAWARDPDDPTRFAYEIVAE